MAGQSSGVVSSHHAEVSLANTLSKADVPCVLAKGSLVPWRLSDHDKYPTRSSSGDLALSLSDLADLAEMPQKLDSEWVAEAKRLWHSLSEEKRKRRKIEARLDQLESRRYVLATEPEQSEPELTSGMPSEPDGVEEALRQLRQEHEEHVLTLSQFVAETELKGAYAQRRQLEGDAQAADMAKRLAQVADLVAKLRVEVHKVDAKIAERDSAMSEVSPIVEGFPTDSVGSFIISTYAQAGTKADRECEDKNHTADMAQRLPQAEETTAKLRVQHVVHEPLQPCHAAAELQQNHLGSPCAKLIATLQKLPQRDLSTPAVSSPSTSPPSSPRGKLPGLNRRERFFFPKKNTT